MRIGIQNAIKLKPVIKRHYTGNKVIQYTLTFCTCASSINHSGEEHLLNASKVMQKRN
uniref:Uncharacterized protein n=1 Tax=Anguilla anguilla TaxID=7936 RepID=A0A0E9UTF0_ANGAN